MKYVAKLTMLNRATSTTMKLKIHKRRMAIKRKKCKCGCEKYPTFGYAGYYFRCATNEVVDAKKNRCDAKKDTHNEWFNARRMEMTGRCIICGGKTEAHNNKTFKRSIAHIFDKRKTMFPEVAEHEDNFIEVCFYGNSCHTNFDNNILTLDKIRNQNPAAFETIKRKANRIIPYIAPSNYYKIKKELL